MAARGSYTWAVENYGKPCVTSTMERVSVSGIPLLVAGGTGPVWSAVGGVFDVYGYELRRTDTGSYNCRPTTGGSTPSRHAHALAVDFNWRTNPYIRTPTLRPIRWGVDTDMPAAMVRDIEGIRVGSHTALEWGGRWRSVKDPMHFQILVTAAEIRKYGVSSPKDVDEKSEVVLRRGDTGPAVRKLQEAIAAWNPHALSESYSIDEFGRRIYDESYGPDVEKWVAIYQQAAKIPRVVEGVADPTTIAYLLAHHPSVKDDA